MRFASLGFAPVLFFAVAIAQQSPTPAADTTPASQAATAASDAPAAGHVDENAAKAEAKAQKQAEKDRKQAEKDAKYLKLQDNEIVATTFDENGNPIKLPPCSRQDKLCQQKRKELLKQKRVGLAVQNGTLTVDGWTGKARLNYDIKNLQYLYVSIPGYGTVIASPERFPGSAEFKDGLDGQTLTISTADQHMVQLSSDVRLAGKGKRSLYYSVDKGYTQPGAFPSVGFGFVNKPPYAWPGALPLTEEQKRRVARAPELPHGMEARAMTLPCQTVAPGDTPKQIKVNGSLVTPPACKPGEGGGTPGAYAAGERPPDGSGAASTGIAAGTGSAAGTGNAAGQGKP